LLHRALIRSARTASIARDGRHSTVLVDIERSGGPEDNAAVPNSAPRGFRAAWKNAIVPVNRTSSGECRILSPQYA
jgi:hypothetical protein